MGGEKTVTKIQQKVLGMLAANNGQVTSQMLQMLIDDHKKQAAEMKRKYDAYKAEDLEIKKRTFQDETKINSKINCDYRASIINDVVGYVYGKPITYQIDKNNYPETEYKTYSKKLSDFKIVNNVEDLDSETGKKAAICGYGARLCYIDTNAIERVVNIDPWECIFLEDNVDEPQYALRYYIITDSEGKETLRVEWYDAEYVSFYVKGTSDFELDPNEASKQHLFSGVPLLKFQNNDEEQGDFDKVESLIDAMDRVVSDCQNEIEEFRLAYMLFYGVEIDKETIQKARQTGAFGGLDAGEGNKVEFLTKEINSEFLENHKKTLNEYIYKFSQSVDMSDEKFSGSTMTGEARKWKLLPLENKAITKERKFTKALRQMWKLICSSWDKRGIKLNYIDIFFEFHRNIPIDLGYVGDTAMKLKGIVSDRTLLSIIPFVDDVDYELKTIAEEMQDAIDLDKTNTDDDLEKKEKEET
jgi:SPP1 family phage portal protein